MDKTEKMETVKEAALEGATGIPVVVKAAPPIAVSAATFFGYPVADVIQYVTLIYLIALCVSQIFKIIRSSADWWGAQKLKQEIEDADS